MKTINIEGHTFDRELFSSGWIIDAGARRFTFHRMLGCNPVVSLDIEDLGAPPSRMSSFPGYFRQSALMHKSGKVKGYFFGDGSANFIEGVNETPYNGPDRPCEEKQIDAITLSDVYEFTGYNIDLLKLDIEGSEYEILANLEPIPRQVTVEMHQHCHEKKHNEWIDRVLAHMEKHYQLFLFPDKDWPQYKYMDCLFIRKDLL